jgi:undecaprenyl-diphosphatase
VKNKDLKWTLICFLIILILAIGFSRIYLRVHYASDVIAGYCIGFLWLVFTVWLLNKIEKYSIHKMAPEIRPPLPDANAA